MGYIPVSFAVDLVEIDRLVDDSIVAFGSPVARQAYPYLVVKHSP